MNNKNILLYLILLAAYGIANAVPATDAPASGSPNTADQSKRTISDQSLTARIQHKLKGSPQTRGLDIQVVTKRGIVSLSGQVPSAKAKAYADKLVRGQEGVRNVHNYLMVSDGANK